jgi:hypothetical protein
MKLKHIKNKQLLKIKQDKNEIMDPHLYLNSQFY